MDIPSFKIKDGEMDKASHCGRYLAPKKQIQMLLGGLSIDKVTNHSNNALGESKNLGIKLETMRFLDL
jgi:hypothetical protein